MADTRQPIQTTAVLFEHGVLVYEINGNKVSQADFNAVSAWRMAMALEEIATSDDEEEEAAPEPTAEPAKPSETDIFGTGK